MELWNLLRDGVDALGDVRTHGQGREQEHSEAGDGEQVRLVHVVHGQTDSILHAALDVEQRVNVDRHVAEPGEGFGARRLTAVLRDGVVIPYLVPHVPERSRERANLSPCAS